MNWKGTILDNMGYFSLYDIPNLFLAILAAALLVYLSAKFGLRVRTAELSALMALSATVALGVGLVKGQLVFAVILAAILIVAKGSVPKEISGGGLLLAMVIGLGCGSGATLITLVALVPLVVLLRMTGKSE
ncbi:MAG: hypothetical protein WAR83_00160 [Flavobacteriales bacterium]